MRIINILSLLIFSCICIGAQEFDSTALNRYFDQLGMYNRFMGAVAISCDGQMEYEKYIGFASTEKKLPVTNETVFRVGSISKIFTAAMIFQLVDEGKLSLDSRLSQFYPQIANAEFITVEDMLQHRSGIFNLTDERAYTKYMASPQSREKMLERFAEFRPVFRPGEKHEYSNSNYILLGYIIEQIVGKPYSEVLEEKISSPLKLSNTYYGKTRDTDSNEAYSYNFMRNRWSLFPKETDMSVPHGAGAVVSTPGDLTRFITGLFNGKCVSDSSLEEMTELHEGFGNGLFAYNFRDVPAYGHNGGIDAFISTLLYYPDERVAVAVLGNGVNHNFEEITTAAVNFRFGLPFNYADFSLNAIELSKDELKLYEGIFSSGKLPIKITLKCKLGKLKMQATGQKAFRLTPVSVSQLRFEEAGIELFFNVDYKGDVLYDSFVLIQGGIEYPFIKEEREMHPLQFKRKQDDTVLF